MLSFNVASVIFLASPPGMTLLTAKAGFISTVLDAGYTSSWCHYNAALRTKVAEIQAQITAGVGLTLISLYINPRQFAFQFPHWLEMSKEGLII
jgi:fatty acid synthase subunit beta